MVERWRKKERELISDLGGRGTPGSGNQWFAKGDGDNKLFKFEVKTTEHNSYSLKNETLKKIESEALFAHRSAATILDINGYQCVVVPFKLFQQMAKCWEEAQEMPP